MITNRIGRCLSATVLASGMILAMVSVAAADCPAGPVWPYDVERVRGDTFVGVFEGYAGGGPDVGVDHWRVQRVYAGSLATGELEGWLRPSSCEHPAVFEAGVRYLVSSARGGGDAFNTVAYQMLGDGELKLVVLGGGRPSDLPDVFHVASLAAALRILIPETLPPTDESSSQVGGAASDPRVLVSIFLGAFVLLGLRSSRRQRMGG